MLKHKSSQLRVETESEIGILMQAGNEWEGHQTVMRWTIRIQQTKQKSISVESKGNASANCCKGIQGSKEINIPLNKTSGILNWPRNVSVFHSILRMTIFRSLIKTILLIYLWLRWIFTAAGGLSLVEEPGSLQSTGSRLHRLQKLWQAGLVVVHGLSGSLACGISLDQGSNPCLLHWQADS